MSDADQPQGSATGYGVMLIELADAYELNGDCMQCRGCKRMQEISWRLHAFPHRADCKHEGSDPRPWLLLGKALECAPVKPVKEEEAA